MHDNIHQSCLRWFIFSKIVIARALKESSYPGNINLSLIWRFPSHPCFTHSDGISQASSLIISLFRVRDDDTIENFQLFHRPRIWWKIFEWKNVLLWEMMLWSHDSFPWIMLLSLFLLVIQDTFTMQPTWQFNVKFSKLCMDRINNW